MAILQLVFAIAAILWLTLLPLGGVLRWVQALAIGICLLALYFAGFWLWPSIWTPYLLIGLWGLVTAFGPRRGESSGGAWLRRDGGMGHSPRRTGLWLAVILLFTGTVVTGFGFIGSQQPNGQAVDIALPLGPGHYYVAQGGGNALVNAHLMTLDPDTGRYADWRGQSFAVDIVAIDDLGRRKGSGPANDPVSYRIFGRAVMAPCAGKVIEADSDLPDMPVPETDRTHMLGNHVILDCDGVWIVMAHMKQGSIRVGKGANVGEGDLLGVVGNSGNSSEPHLHIHAQMPGNADAPISAEPVWLTINGRFPVRGQLFTSD